MMAKVVAMEKMEVMERALPVFQRPQDQQVPPDQSEPPVLLALLVHQVQSVQQDLPEPLVHQEVVQELLDRKARGGQRDHEVQREVRVRRALRVQTEQLVQLDR